MHNREEDIEILKKKKVQFATAFVDAVTNQSVQKSKKLIVPFDIYKKLVDDKEMTAEKYDEALTLQCQNFFKKNKDFFDEHKERLLKDEFASSTIYDLGDKHEIEDGLYFSTIDALSVSMSENVLEDGTVSTLGFQIDNPVAVNNEIYINNFLSIKAYESLDDSNKVKNQYEKIGFKELTIDKYVELIKDRGFDISSEYKDISWFVYEGDLTLSSDDFNNLADYRGFLITGNLVVDGNAYIDYNNIIVLQDFKAKNILIELDDCSLLAGFCVLGTLFFDEVIIIQPNDSPFVYMNSIEGKLVFAGYSCEMINVEREKVKFFYDMHGDRSFGEVEKFLEDRFSYQYDEDEVHVDLNELHDAVLNNETIFKK